MTNTYGSHDKPVIIDIYESELPGEHWAASSPWWIRWYRIWRLKRKYQACWDNSRVPKLSEKETK